MTYMTFDIEADGLLDEATKIHCISISTDFEEPKCFTDIDHALKILNWAETLIGHNIISYDLPLLKKLCSWEPKTNQKIYDTFPISKILWPDISKKDMKLDIPKKYWGRYSLRAFGYRMDMHKGDMDSYLTMTEEMAAYCKQDVRITSDLFKRIYKRYESEVDWWESAIDLELKFARVAHEMEEVGIFFDIDAAIDLYDTLAIDRDAALDKLKGLVPATVVELKTPQYWVDPLTFCQYKTKSDAPQEFRKDLERGPNKTRVTEFNPMSRIQVADFLMSKGWEPMNTTPTGRPKVDEGTLLAIDDIPEAVVIAELYRTQKIIAMLAEGKEAWMKLTDGERIHPHLNTIGAVSGRTSCVRPNLQQVPSSRLQYGAECRKLFSAPTGFSLVSCDAKSLEVRCFAHYMSKYDSGEFAKEVVSGDVHQANADMMKCDRQTAKNTFFALIYGASPKKISTMLDIDVDAASDLVENLFNKRPAMGHLISGIKRLASNRGYLRGLDGRRLVPRSEHSSVNLLIQAAGACVSKQATVNLYNDIIKNRLGCHGVKIVGFIHDEILLEAPTETGDVVLEMAVKAFKRTTGQFKLRCDMDGEGSIGKNWYEVH